MIMKLKKNPQRLKQAPLYHNITGLKNVSFETIHMRGLKQKKTMNNM